MNHGHYPARRVSVRSGGRRDGCREGAGPALQEAPFRGYASCLPDYLRTLAADAYARRKARIATLDTPAAIDQYQSWARRTFIQLAGGLPERTPLNVRTTGAFDRARYRVEKLAYESQPGLFVTANLYLPKDGSPPFPGVLFQMGHANNGKGYEPYQRCCQGLVQLGYMVLAFDPMGQGERTNYPQPGGWLTRLASPTQEHLVPGRQMLLVGQTASGMQVWDAIRSLDVLAAHPSVDARRLATTGQSGGGTLSMLLAAADERLAAAAIASGNTENFAANPYFPPGSTDNAEQDLIGSAPLAFDRWDLLWPIAPKPLLVAISGHDFFGTYSPSYETSGREEFANLARAYSAMGAPERLQWYETPLPHSLSYSFRLAIYNFFGALPAPWGPNRQCRAPHRAGDGPDPVVRRDGQRGSGFRGQDAVPSDAGTGRLHCDPRRAGRPARAARHGQAGHPAAPGSARASSLPRLRRAGRGGEHRGQGLGRPPGCFCPSGLGPGSCSSSSRTAAARIGPKATFARSWHPRASPFAPPTCAASAIWNPNSAPAPPGISARGK